MLCFTDIVLFLLGLCFTNNMLCLANVCCVSLICVLFHKYSSTSTFIELIKSVRHHINCKIIKAKNKVYLTIILRNRAEYRLTLSRRGRIVG